MMTWLFVGVLSAYALTPTVAQTQYQQYYGNIPDDLSGYDALIAVDHCGLIGSEAVLHTQDGDFSAIVYDCAGSDGAAYFTDGNDTSTPWLMAGEVDYHFWMEHPELIGTEVQIEVLLEF